MEELEGYEIVTNENVVDPKQHIAEVSGTPDPPSENKLEGLDNYELVDTSFKMQSDESIKNFNTEDYNDILGDDIYMPTGGVEALNLKRAQNQSGFAQARNMIGQAVVGEIIGGTIEGLGYLLEIPNMLSYADGTEKDWGNFITDSGKSLREGSREAMPIHQTGEGFNPSDSGWWFSNGVSVASSLSMLIPSGAATKALSFAGKTSSRGLGAISKSLDIAAKMGKQQKWMTKGITQAVVSRHIENSMEASGTFNDQKKKYLQKFDPKTGEKFTEEEATRLASEAAASNYRMGWAMLLQDIPQYLAIGKVFNPRSMKMESALSKGVNKTGKASRISNYAKGAGATFVSEGFEESYQYFIAERGKLLSDLKAGLITEEEYSKKLKSKIGDEEMMSSAFWGGLGGNLFQAVGPASNNLFKSKATKEREDNYAKITGEFIEQRGAQFVEMQKILSQADQGTDPVAREHAANALLFNLTLDHIDLDKFDAHIESLNNLRDMTQEEVAGFKEQGTDVDVDLIKKYIPKAIEEAHKVRADYLKHLNKNEPGIARKLAENSYNTREFVAAKDKLSKEIKDIRNNIHGNSNVSTYRQERFNNGIRLSTLRRLEKFQEKNKIGASPERAKAIDKIIKSNKSEQSRIMRKMGENKKVDPRDEDSKLNDEKYFAGFKAAKDEIVSKSISEELYDNEIRLMSEENSLLTSPAYKKEFKKKQREAELKKVKTQEEVDNAKKNVEENEDLTPSEKEEVNEALDKKSDALKAEAKREELKKTKAETTSQATQKANTESVENTAVTPDANIAPINEVIEDEYADEEVTPIDTFIGVDETAKDSKIDSSDQIGMLNTGPSPLLDEWLANGKDKTGTPVRYVLGDGMDTVMSKAIKIFKGLKPGDEVSKGLAANLPIKVMIGDNPSLYSFLFAHKTGDTSAKGKKELTEKVKIIREMVNNGGFADSEISMQYGGNLQLDVMEGGIIPENNLMDLQPVTGMKYLQDNLMFTNEKGVMQDLSKKPVAGYKPVKIERTVNGKNKPVPLKGAMFLKVPKMDGHEFPLKLNVKKVSNSEASLITSMLKEILNPSTEISLGTTIDNLPAHILSDLKTNHSRYLATLGRDNVNLAKIIGGLAHMDISTSGKNSEFHFLEEGFGLKFGNVPGQLIDKDNWNDLEATLMEFLTTKKSRHFRVSEFANNAAYRRYIIEEGILSTDAVTNAPLFNKEATTGQKKRKSGIYIAAIKDHKADVVDKVDENLSPEAQAIEVRRAKSLKNGTADSFVQPGAIGMQFYRKDGNNIEVTAPTAEAVIEKVNKRYDTELSKIQKKALPLTENKELSNDIKDTLNVSDFEFKSEFKTATELGLKVENFETVKKDESMQRIMKELKEMDTSKFEKKKYKKRCKKKK